MKGKHVIILALLVIATVGAALYMQTPDTQSSDSKAPLVPGLGTRINDVTQLRLTKAGNETIATLRATDQGWTVAERHDYPADSGKVRKLLIDLSKAEVLEQKTAHPDLYSKLGVQDISAQDATGTKLEIEGLSEPVEILVGDTASSLTATYVRRADEAQSLMVSGQLEPAMETTDWLDKELIDIPSERIQAVKITRPDGDNVIARKNARGQQLEVQNIPKGRELTSPTAVTNLGTALSATNLMDVMKRSELDVNPEDAVVTEFRTFDGLIVTSTAFKREDTLYASFDVSFDGDLAREYYVPPEDESTEEATPASQETSGQDGEPGETAPAATGDETPEIDPSAFDAAREEAERLGTKFQDWAFEIAQYKYNNLTKPLSSLLKVEE